MCATCSTCVGVGRAEGGAARGWTAGPPGYTRTHAVATQIKDRHNGNILLTAEGHVVHIDFGFMLTNSPGNMQFEKAPFKLTQDFVDLLGGPRSSMFRSFRALCVKSYLALRKVCS